jgi:hypothetical protein
MKKKMEHKEEKKNKNKTKINIFRWALETPNKTLIKITTIIIQSKICHLSYEGFNNTSKIEIN